MRTALSGAREDAGAEAEAVDVGEQQAEGGVEGDREDGRDDHGEVLGVGEGLEEAAFLRFEREDGEERDGDDEEGEEAGAADFFHGVDDDAAIVGGAAGFLPLFEFLVGLLDDDDGGVDHRADGDRDAAEGHDVGADAEGAHRDERDEDGDGDGDDRDDGARDVPEEDEDDERDDDQLFDEGVLEVVDGGEDELGAVVGGDDFDARGEAGLEVFEFGFDAVDDLEGVFALADDDDAGDGFALAVEVGDAAADVGADDDGADVFDRDGDAAGSGGEGDLLEVGGGAGVAASADHVLAAGEFDEASADIVVAAADGGDDFRERDVEGGEFLADRR